MKGLLLFFNMKKLIVLLVLLSQMSFGQNLPLTHFSVQSGKWSSPSTWNTNTVPNLASHRVMISQSTVVILDMDVVVDSVWVIERNDAALLWQYGKSLNNVFRFGTDDANFVGDVTNKNNGQFNDGFTWLGFNPPTTTQSVEIKEYSRIEINSDVTVNKWVNRTGGYFSINWGKSLNRIKYLR